MSTYTYSNWMSQSTLAERLTTARLHHAELSDAITANVAAGGKSRSSDPLNTALQRLEAQITDMEKRLGLDGRGGDVLQVDMR